jgi:hypothetical protein
MKPFKIKPLEFEGKLEKLLNLKKKKNLLIEINNYLAESEINDLNHNKLDDLLQKYNIESLQKMDQGVRGLIEDFIRFYIPNEQISEFDFLKINTLIYFLKNDPKDFFDQIHSQIEIRFSREALKIISNGKSIKENNDELDQIQAKLNITDKDFNRIVDKIRFELVNSRFQEIIQDGLLSPEEDKEFKNLSTKLSVVVEHDDATKELIEKAKLRWEIENGQLPSVIPDINIQKNEMCFIQTFGNYFEYKTVTSRIGYSGPTFRLKIVKGVYFRSGSLATKRETKEILSKIGSGSIYLTNKRVIFLGSNRSYNIRLNKILDIDIFSDGVKIVKDAGRAVFLELQNSEIFGLILTRAIKEFVG